MFAYVISNGKIKKINVDNLKIETSLVYSICYYGSRNQISNIARQISQATKLVQDTDVDLTFVAMCGFDSMLETHIEECFEHIFKIIEEKNKFEIILFPVFNWGGTIATLWHLWNDILKRSQNNVKYVSHMEEDITVFNTDWLRLAKDILQNFVYVGETTLKDIGSFKQTSGRGTSGGEIGRTKVSDVESWTDGGFYFTTPENLKKIEDTIGIFHKGDQTTKCDLHYDGVDLGEVGFPTILYNSGMRFTSIPRSFFIYHP